MVIRIKNVSNELVQIFEKLNKKDVSFNVTYKGNKDVIIRVPEDCKEPEQEMTFAQFNMATRYNFKNDLGDIIILQMDGMLNNNSFDNNKFIELSNQLLDFFFSSPSCKNFVEHEEEAQIVIDPIPVHYIEFDMIYTDIVGFFIDKDGDYMVRVSRETDPIFGSASICELEPTNVYQAFCQINKMRNKK